MVSHPKILSQPTMIMIATATTSPAATLGRRDQAPPHVQLRRTNNPVLQHKEPLLAVDGTRIITFPYLANLTTLSSLIAHLAAALHIVAPFSLKYQLRNHDLYSLISLSTDKDLLIMLDEHKQQHHHGGGGYRAAPHRIRLFLFPTTPTKPVSTDFVAQPAQLKHPKTESWFVDALNKQDKASFRLTYVGLVLVLGI
ncbi:hypothetical protein Tsubulata_018856 [Turnera subulata]|uniref:PB1 domain-containing protein n=1 Tax=Turnera subulata TaxID=218843 RepID=A0A9Q0FLH7_9ROSI|nr:hypothetical protein Tsubulata_018856 [Turnera subulata]